MRQYAEENGFGKHPTMNLIASYFGEKIVISSEMASLYLKLGFNISEVTEVSIRSGPIHPRSNPLQPPPRMVFSYIPPTPHLPMNMMMNNNNKFFDMIFIEITLLIYAA